jgi:thymidylate kinase
MGQNMTQGRQPGIIEFFGPPGSGKSTLSHLVADQLRTKDIPIREPSYEQDHRKTIGVRQRHKLLQAVKQMIYNPVFSFRAILLILRSRQKNPKDTVKLAINLLYISQYYRECKRDHTVFMFDQGFFQAICSILFSATYRSDLEDRVFSLIEDLLSECCYVLVHVQADQATAIARMKQRDSNDSRLEKLNDEAEMRRQLNGYYQSLSETEGLVNRWNKIVIQSGTSHMNVIRVENGNGSSLMNNQMSLAGNMEKIFDEFIIKELNSHIKIHNG